MVSKLALLLASSLTSPNGVAIVPAKALGCIFRCQRPPACRRGLARALLLTSPLVLRQEPLGRSVDVRPLGVASQPQALQVRRSTGRRGVNASASGSVSAPKHGRGSPFPRKRSPKGWQMSMVKATSVGGGWRTGDLVRASVPARSVKAGV
jgi:hypothetical protein